MLRIGIFTGEIYDSKTSDFPKECAEVISPDSFPEPLSDLNLGILRQRVAVKRLTHCTKCHVCEESTKPRPGKVYSWSSGCFVDHAGYDYDGPNDVLI